MATEMRGAFIYLSYKPQATAPRIKRFYNSLKKTVPHLDFHIVTFDEAGEAGTQIKKFETSEAWHTTYNNNSIMKLGYSSKGTHGGENFKDGNVDIPVILFWLDHPEYTFFWVVEDDIEYTGDFGSFIKSLGDSNGDTELACTHVRPLPDGWDHLHLFSCGDDVISPSFPLRVCFLPFFYVTSTALTTIDAAYRRGWKGHNEMTWAVILDVAGLRIRDIGGNGPYVAPEDRKRHYIDDSPHDFSKYGSFGTMKIRLSAGKKPDTLYHPVKTPKNFIKMKWSRIVSICHWYMNKLYSQKAR